MGVLEGWDVMVLAGVLVWVTVGVGVTVDVRVTVEVRVRVAVSVGVGDSVPLQPAAPSMIMPIINRINIFGDVRRMITFMAGLSH